MGTPQGQSIFFAPLISFCAGLLVIGLCPGRRNKFSAQWMAIIGFSVLPFIFSRDFLPPLLCITDSISPVISSCIYPLLLSIYEGVYLPLIFWVWHFDSRRDTPYLGLSFQLAQFNAFSEALFCGGLIAMVHRYSEAELPRIAGVAILGRCFGGKLLNRSGFWEYCGSCIWCNSMTSQRDLIGRHAHAQYLFSIVFVMLLAIGAFSILSFEAFTGRQVSAPYTKPAFWIVLLSNAFMSVLTELCVAALTFVQRRQAVASTAGAQTFVQTFMAMHRSGMQPYTTTFRGIFGLGPAAERSFEAFDPESEVSDRCHQCASVSSP